MIAYSELPELHFGPLSTLLFILVVVLVVAGIVMETEKPARDLSHEVRKRSRELIESQARAKAEEIRRDVQAKVGPNRSVSVTYKIR